MMFRRYYLPLFLILFSSTGFSQERKEIVAADVVTINSKILNEKRTVWVYSPGNKKDRKAYPVLYVLDGETHFNSVIAMVEHLSGASIIPRMIVVGILHSNRMKDLTPSGKNAGVGSNTENTGGGKNFISFVNDELFPLIELKYSTAPYRLLFGHSLGGLTVINTLIHHKDLFNAYASIDASLWWDQHKLLDESRVALAVHNYPNKKLFLAIANRMEKGIDTSAVQADTTENTELIRYNLELIRSIKANPQNELKFTHKYYRDDNHNSVSFIAEYDALRFIFDFYKFDVYASYLDKENLSLDSLLATHFTNVSKEMGYTVHPSEELVNGLAYYSLNTKQLRKAEQLFKMNVLNYPKSANAFDSMGDFYVATGDKINAGKCFEKALELTELPATRAKLKTLELKN